MKKWKVAFWLTMFFLLLSNLFWVYQVLDMAVGSSYYEVSCGEWKMDSQNFIKVLDKFTEEQELNRFLQDNQIKYEVVNKGRNEKYIVVGSVTVGYDSKGMIQPVDGN